MARRGPAPSRSRRPHSHNDCSGRSRNSSPGSRCTIQDRRAVCIGQPRHHRMRGNSPPEAARSTCRPTAASSVGMPVTDEHGYQLIAPRLPDRGHRRYLIHAAALRTGRQEAPDLRHVGVEGKHHHHRPEHAAHVGTIPRNPTPRNVSLLTDDESRSSPATSVAPIIRARRRGPSLVKPSPPICSNQSMAISPDQKCSSRTWVRAEDRGLQHRRRRTGILRRG